jgi:hypothetical protein
VLLLAPVISRGFLVLCINFTQPKNTFPSASRHDVLSLGAPQLSRKPNERRECCVQIDEIVFM